MDYEKAYKEAMEKVRSLHDNANEISKLIDLREELEGIFPELKESEDEKIRKEIIAFLTYYHTGQGNSVKYDDGWIAWLEKQGEYDRIVEKAKSEKQRVLLTETNGNANIDWDTRSLDDVKILLKCGLEYIRTIEANKQILSDSRFGGCSSRIPTRYDKGIKQGGQKPVDVTDEWIEDYWHHEKVNNPDSYDKGDEIQFDHQGFVNFCKTYCKKPAEWSEHQHKLLNYAISMTNDTEVKRFLESLRDKECRESAGWTHKDGKNLAELWEILSVHRNTNPKVDSLMEWVKELRAKLDSLSKEDFKKVFDKYAVDFNEEPVSEIDFEQELYKYFGQVKDFTLGMRIAKRFYEIGRNHQEPASEDLEKEVYEHLWKGRMGADVSKPIYFSYDELLEVARHFASWQKEQMLAKAVDVTIAIPYPNGYGGYTQLVDSQEALPFGEKVKVLVIKEN